MAARYLVIARDLTGELRLMRQSGTERLPSEAELCRHYNCSRQTIRSALSVLAENGLIIKKRGSGSYLADSVSSLSHEVCVIVPDPDEYIYPAVIRDIKNELSSHGYSVRCLATDGNLLREREILRSLLNDPPAGIILEAVNSALPCLNTNLFRQLQSAKVPLVFLHAGYDSLPDIPCVSEDNYIGAYDLVSYLASGKHTRIAGILQGDDRRGTERYRGFAQACIDLGLEFRQNNILWYTSEERRRMLDGSDELQRRFIRDYLKPCTAVVCFNDEISYHLVQSLSAAGIEVPENLSVVSFDNSYYSRLGAVSITSAGHDIHAAGRAAANTLISVIAGKQCSPEPLPWQIVERESSGSVI